MSQSSWLVRVRNWVLTYRWWLMGLIGAVNIAFELLEHRGSGNFDVRFSVEIFLFGFFYPFSAGWFLTLLQRSEQTILQAAQQQHLSLRFRQRLGFVQDWVELRELLVHSLQDVASFQNIAVYVYDKNQVLFETAVSWHHPDSPAPELPARLAPPPNALLPDTLHIIDQNAFPALPSAGEHTGYCLPLNLAKSYCALAFLHLRQGATLTDAQSQVLNEWRHTLAFAIAAFHPVASQPTWLVATEAERRRIAQRLYDTTAQRLNILTMKLNALYAAEELPEASTVRQELLEMVNIADLTYKQIRLTLQSMQTPADLIGSLRDQVTSIGEMADLAVDFQFTGTASPLPSYVLNNILSITREVTLNAGKHAQASHLQVLVNWSPQTLNIDIADNGLGFHAENDQSDGHFGLLLIRERAMEINGRLAIHSQPGSGTKVSFSLPLA